MDQNLEELKWIEKELAIKESEMFHLLSKIRHELRETQLAIIKEVFGLFPGKIVKDREGKLYKVAQIKPIQNGKPWVTGNPIKKDGTFGKSDKVLYDYWDISKPYDSEK